MTWLHKTRLRVLAYVAGVLLAAVGLVSLTTVPAWPILGVAVAAFVMVINRTAGRLSEQTCLGCGRDVAGHPAGEHGVHCPACGTISYSATARHKSATARRFGAAVMGTASKDDRSV